MIKTRTDIINYLIKKYDYDTYLEIGVSKGKNFRAVDIRYKDGADPNFPCKFKMTSDKFFEQNKMFYNIIFIDGLHLENQVMKDINNSLSFITPNGVIVVHDCNPSNESNQTEVVTRFWTGTVWKAWARQRITKPDLYMCVVDIDWGVGIIRPGKQEPLHLLGNYGLDNLDYQFFDRNRKNLLNLISVEEFTKKF